MKPKIVTWRLSNCRRNTKENGTEALEKLIASKVNNYVEVGRPNLTKAKNIQIL